MTEFAGATVLITGAASGIGAATARLLEARGARLILVDRNPTGLANFRNARVIVGDVADPELWQSAELTSLSHAVINAGISRGGTQIADLDFAQWREVLSTNLDGAFLSLSAAMRALRDGGRGGAIVLTASAMGLKAEPGIAAYAASKAALIHLGKVAAKEGAPDRIRVNAIAPAGVETPIWSSMPFFQHLAADEGGEDAAYAAMARQSTPLGRYAKPEEVAAQIAFLLSDQAALITGTCLLSDGGYTL